jgi:hypothetical protein
MNTIDQNRQKLLAELIEQSVKIDHLVRISKLLSAETTFNYTQDLEELRARQRETTSKLHALEEHNSNVWENIGNGG